jgi:hypothetical protein
MFLHHENEAREGEVKIPRLHLAARMGYVEEVRRLVDEQGVDAMETNFCGDTAREMLETFTEDMSDEGEYDEGYPARVHDILRFLSIKEMERPSSA